MASGRTSRLGLDYPLTSDAPTIAQDIQAVVTQIDSYVDGWQQGLAASRATAWPTPPAGARYHAIDTGVDTVYDGSAWVPEVSVPDIAAGLIPYIYPVGCLYFSTTNVNPATELGFGTWSAYAAGRVPIGVGTGTDVDSNTMAITPGETGGEYLHDLTAAESGLPAHSHTITDPDHTHSITDPHHTHSITDPHHSHGVTDPEHSHEITVEVTGTPSAGTVAVGNGTPQSNANTDTSPTGVSVDSAATGITGAGSAATGITGAGSAATGITGTAAVSAAAAANAHNNVQPFIGVNIWRRTA